MNLFTVQLLLSLLCNLSTALSESADGGRPIYTCANAVTVGVRLIRRENCTALQLSSKANTRLAAKEVEKKTIYNCVQKALPMVLVAIDQQEKFDSNILPKN